MRPTSETVIGEYMAKWVQSYRDLPLLLNQWANVVRWELRPRLFLRTTEFLWQEGHTVHATYEDARDLRRAHPPRRLRGLHGQRARDARRDRAARRPSERFAGAINTLTCEAMMGDGKALQMGTSHELGQNFAKAFDIEYLDEGGTQQTGWTTSWGVSTRMVGGLIMGHGDDAGLRIPPRLAAVQVRGARPPRRGRRGRPVRGARRRAAAPPACASSSTTRSTSSFGRRATDWELKGVPVRLELGPRDLAEGGSPSCDRDHRRRRRRSPLDRRRRRRRRRCSRSSRPTLLAEATERRDARTVDVATARRGRRGRGRRAGPASPGPRVGEEGEAVLAQSSVTVRCLRAPRRLAAPSPATRTTSSPSSPAATDRGARRTARQARRGSPRRATMGPRPVAGYSLGPQFVLRSSKAWALPTPSVCQRASGPMPAHGAPTGSFPRTPR